MIQAGAFLEIMRENPGPVYQISAWHQSHIKLSRYADQRAVDLFSKPFPTGYERAPGHYKNVQPAISHTQKFVKI